MFEKKYLDTFVALIYLVLVALFFSLQKTSDYENSSCSYSEQCYRFCCKNEELCNQNYLEVNFNSTYGEEASLDWYDYDGDNTTREVKFFYGKPECFLKDSDPEKPWTLQPVSL